MGKRERKLESEKALGRTDYFEFWLELATKQAPQKKFPVTFLVEALSIIKSAFGEQWIRDQINAIDVKAEFRKRVESVPRWIATPNGNQISSLLELAVYLKQMAHFPNLSRVLEMMKDQKSFDSAFLQLGYAYRFFRLGAEQIEFEPAVDAGRAADILFRWKSETFLCECYSPETGPTPGYVDFMSTNADKVLKSADALDKRINMIVRLSIEYPGKAEERTRLQNACIEIIRKLEVGGHYSEKSEQFEIEAWEMSKSDRKTEHELLDTLRSKVTCGLDHSMVAKNDLRKIMEGNSVSKALKSRFMMAVQSKETDWEEIVGKLANKIEGKIVQLRKGAVSPKGILIVETPYAVFLDLKESEKNKHLERLKKKLQPHINVFGLILAYRAWTPRNRHMYTGHSINTKSDLLTKALFVKLTELENRQEILERCE